MNLGEFIIGATVGFVAGLIFRSLVGPSRLPEVNIVSDITARDAACPFCGESIEDEVYPVEVGGASRQFAMNCDMCGCVGPMRETKEEAASAWRTRTWNGPLSPAASIRLADILGAPRSGRRDL